jgi:hypothetical protein
VTRDLNPCPPDPQLNQGLIRSALYLPKLYVALDLATSESLTPGPGSSDFPPFPGGNKYNLVTTPATPEGRSPRCLDAQPIEPRMVFIGCSVPRTLGGGSESILAAQARPRQGRPGDEQDPGRTSLLSRMMGRGPTETVKASRMTADEHPVSEKGMTRRRMIAGFSIKEFSQPPFRRLPWHEHHDASICFVVSGSYTERLCGAEWECSPDATVFKPPFEGHSDQFGRSGAKCQTGLAPRTAPRL